jgi:eukaryotic-like serine/threonine-protein kinase
MALVVGAHLGQYEILSAIGAGGMGEVYRARDTKLKRDVALKVLPEAFAGDADRMARFQREAEVLASLNHPNIAHIYGVEDGAIVMELVEGDSPKGPMPFEDAWKIAMQIADALEYAHEKGVIHRDLKPANVKVTHDGRSANTLKLLDFGLAKVFSPESGDAEGGTSLTNSPTLSMGATVAGVILGTAAYMAPEQAKGRRPDKRADIWSWGVVLYELLTGDRMFTGDDVADTLAQILTKEPDLERVPPRVRRLLRECLQKDPRLRLRDIGDARRLLEEPSRDSPRRAPPTWSRHVWPALATVLAAISVALGLVTWTHGREEPPPAAKLFFPLPNEAYEPGRPPSTAVSPDGRRIAVTGVTDGKSQLWVRDLDNPTPQILVADGASGMPFWAPDSRHLGFFADGKLKKVDLSGGPAVTIADAQGTTGGIGPWNGSWNNDDLIVFSRITSPLYRVSAAGGSPTKLTELDATRHETAHFAPWFLPDGHHFLYVALSTDSEKRGVFVADLAGSRKQLTLESTRTIYVAQGYLLFVRDGTLLAQRFDSSRLETTAEAVPVAEQVDSRYAGAGVNVGYFSASQNGVLVYTSGRAPTGAQLTWFDRTGKRLETAGAATELGALSLSPDETRVAFTRRDLQAGHYFLWTRDLVHGVESRLTTSRLPPYGGGPTWSADGTHIYYAADGKIVQKAANNTGAEEVVDVPARQPMDASRDGRFLFTVTPRVNDIWVLPLFGDRKAFPYVQSEFQETQPRLSPDGHWLAYQSNESKRNEIYVTSFPQPGEKWQISTDGGQAPVWNRNGRELYYYGGDGKIMAVETQPETRFQFGVPKALFEARIPSNAVTIEVSKDGRFLLPALVEPEASTPMTVVLNWPASLPKKR